MINNYYCSKEDIQKIKDNKKYFINNLIGINIKYSICSLISSSMNEAIKFIEDKNSQTRSVRQVTSKIEKLLQEYREAARDDFRANSKNIFAEIQKTEQQILSYVEGLDTANKELNAENAVVFKECIELKRQIAEAQEKSSKVIELGPLPKPNNEFHDGYGNRREGYTADQMCSYAMREATIRQCTIG